MKSFVERLVTAPVLYAVLSKARRFTGRYFFLVLCAAGLIWYAFFTRSVIGQMKKDALVVTQSYAELIKTALSERMNDQEIEVIFNEIIQKLHFPIVVTDTSFTPVTWKNVADGAFLNRRIVPYVNATAEDRATVRRKVDEYAKRYEPKVLYVNGTTQKIGYLVYSDSDLVKSMSWMPLVEVALIMAVILFAYISFHNVRVNERSNLWVGLAKETAHQLGTPISSLMGWVEFMRTAGDGTDETPTEDVIDNIKKICGNMEHDLERLRKVTARFSQIGSVPALTPCNINKTLDEVMKYFSLRLPLLGRRVAITRNFGEVPIMQANRDLLEWVFENLIRNSLDAINKPDGTVEVSTEYIADEGIIRILHRDNGKGIGWEDQKKVFSPGFTTKSRGWGLGLTLAKRIIEEYHGGKIYVAWSQKDKGTVFCIELPAKSVV